MELMISNQLVWRIRKETLEARHERVNPTTPHLLNKTHDMKTGIPAAHIHITRHKEFHKALFHLLIRKAQVVIPKLWVVLFYRQITTLEKQGDRIMIQILQPGQLIRRSFGIIRQIT